MADTQIEFCTTEELIEELCKRYDDLVIGMRRPTQNSPNEIDFSIRHYGNIHACVGLAWQIGDDIKQKLREILEQDDDD